MPRRENHRDQPGTTFGHRHSGRGARSMGGGIALALALALFGCGAPDSTPEAEREHEIFPSTRFDPETPSLESSEIHSAGFDFQRESPVAFLEFLVSSHVSETDSASFPAVVVRGTHRGWIRHDDVPELIARLDSSQPCAAVVKETSSLLPTSPSTIGREAAFLIAGFRAETTGSGYGGYPPTLSSAHFDYDVTEIREWWTRFEKSVRDR